jgi:hypothetical protein
MLRTRTQSNRYRTPTKLDLKNLALEMDELIKIKQQELILDSWVLFIINEIYYRVHLYNIKDNNHTPLYEYKISRSNIKSPFIHKKNAKKLIIENNYDPIWIEDFYYYLPNTNYYLSNKKNECQISYISKHTFWLDCNDDCNTILK